ncbi:3-oxoacyl-ACP synthase III family protein [Streptomyces sp. NPDC018031]|uniref:3-oxoacyl-ACP synthase III family protein n=1 Tax=Streptomyces sp. NPDC018031 TaxID=3365033 RepID=UPI003788AE63
MTGIHIAGTGGYQPGDPIPTSEIARLAGPLPEEVLEGLSIERRFWMIDPATGEHRENNSDMAYKAAVRALDAAGMEAGDIDLMILATGTPDYPLPPLVNFVQERLGVERCATLEIRSGGAGVVQALDIARMYLAAGVYRTALVIGSEAISPVLAPVFLGKRPESIRMRDRMPLYMFGDGAGAMVLRATDAPGGLLGGASACIGGGRKPGIHSVGGGTHAPIHEQLRAKRLVDLKVDVVGAGDFTPVMVTEAVHHTLERSGVGVDTVDLCLVPEGNVGWMLDSLREAGLDTAEWQALDGKIIDSLATMGAVGCAAVPLFLDDAWRDGRIKPGDRVMLIGVESTKWIYAGMVLDWTADVPA